MGGRLKMKVDYICAFIVTVLCVCNHVQTVDILNFTIREEKPARSSVGFIAAAAGLTQNFTQSTLGRFRYGSLPSTIDDSNYFDTDMMTGEIRTTQVIDRDNLCPFVSRCVLRFSVAIQPPHFRAFPVHVEITDKNDNAPKFPSPVIYKHIAESANPGTAVVSLPAAQDIDAGNFSVQNYSAEGDSASLAKFELVVTDTLDGEKDLELALKEPLDREEREYYLITVTAYDGGKPQKSGSVRVNITVEDANDNPPRFTKETYNADVLESEEVGSHITTVTASDDDIGENGRVTYAFSPRTVSRHGNVFTIEAATGRVILNQALDYEATTSYHLVVQAVDGGVDTRSAHATVIIHVRDVNDNPPRITVNTMTGPTAAVPENEPGGRFVAHVAVDDPDHGNNGKVTCFINEEKFEMQNAENAYTVITKTELDREEHDTHTIRLTCHDGAVSPLYSFQNISVTVQDVNDNPPVFSQQIYSTDITENNAPGYLLLHVSATDRDIGNNGQVRYVFASNAPRRKLSLNPVQGSIRASVPLDYEDGSPLRFTVNAYDEGVPALTSSVTVIVNITNINDEAPYFNKTEYTLGVSENEPPGTIVGQLTANDRDAAPFNVMIYSIEGEAQEESTFHIEKRTGVITTKKVLDREDRQSYYMVVVARNKAANLSNRTNLIINVGDVNDNPPVFIYPTPYNNTVMISNKVPLAHVVTRVIARDSDYNGNSLLSFTYDKPTSASRLFELDETTGALTTASSLSHIEHKVFNVTIRAQDHGEEPLYATADLRVIVTKDKMMSQPGRHGEQRSNLNSTIVIAVGCASALVIMILVIAILCIHMKDRRGKAMHRYNCRMEAQKMLNAGGGNSLQDDRMTASQSPSLSSPVPPPDGAEFTYRSYLQLHPQSSPMKCADTLGHHGLSDGPLAEGSREGSHRSSPTVWEPVGSPQCWPANLSHNLIEDPRGSSTHLCNGEEFDGCHGRTPPVGTQNPVAAPRSMQNDKRVGWGTLRDADAGSACSGDMSTTDSGRGGSEGSDGHPSSKLGTFHSPSESGEIERNNSSFDSSTSNSFTVPRDRSGCCQSNAKQDVPKGNASARTLGRQSDYLPCPCQKSSQPSYDSFLPMHPMLSPNNTFSPVRKNTHALPSYPTVMETDLDCIYENNSNNRIDTCGQNGNTNIQGFGTNSQHARSQGNTSSGPYGYSRQPVPATRHRGVGIDGSSTDCADSTSVVSGTSGSYIMDHSEHVDFSLANLRESTA